MHETIRGGAGRLLQRGLPAAFLVAGSATIGEAGWEVLPNAPLAPDVAARHDDLAFSGPDSVWVVNGAGEIHRTTDGGGTWELQAAVPNYVRSVGFATSRRGWAGCLFGPPLLYSTTDAGESWVPVVNIPVPQPRGICGISVVNGSVVYACGKYDVAPSGMIKTTDGGLTWTSWDMTPYASSLIDCHFFDADNGIAVGGVGPSLEDRYAVVLSTTDGGASWETRHATNRPGGEWGWKISFVDRDVGFVSLERRDQTPSYILKTTDGGGSWTDIPFLFGYDQEGIGFASESLGWVGGWSGPTYETTDGGASWHPAGFGLFVNRIRFVSPALAYAVGDRIYKYTPDATAVAAAPVGDVPLSVYPNPARTWTRISFTIDAPTEARLTIHDARGRRIATLFEGPRPAGVHELAWSTTDDDGHRVAPGVYWFRVQSDQGVRATRVVVVR